MPGRILSYLKPCKQLPADELIWYVPHLGVAFKHLIILFRIRVSYRAQINGIDLYNAGSRPLIRAL